MKKRKDIQLTTYANVEDSDGFITEFVISSDTFNRLIKEYEWKNRKEFMENYTWDHSESIYRDAKAQDLIIDEEVVQR